MRKANYRVVSNLPNEPLIIEDHGPWDLYPTVTNVAEDVVEELWDHNLLPGNRVLLCLDSEGNLDELLHEGSRFTGFAPGPDLSIDK